MDTTDGLTGLADRSSFLTQLDRAVSQARQNKQNVTVMVADLDHFMKVNETYGHVAGDQVLATTAARLAEVFQPYGPVGRYGGDEMIAAVIDQSARTVFSLAEEARQKIEESITFNNPGEQSIRLNVTISLGLAYYPADGTDINDLIDKAKEAMFRAKQAGGARICFYEEKDGLTGLFNYYGIVRRLDDLCMAAAHQRQVFSIFLADIDLFGEINAQYGHLFGDEMITRLANILKANFKEENLIGRFGGDQFIVLMPGLSADSTFILADEVRRLVEDAVIPLSINAHSQDIHFHISGGIATCPMDGSERVDLLRKADEAMYHAKQTTRNRICLPTTGQMVTKTSHFTQTQLERLTALARKMDKSEAYLLREALDDLFRKFGEN